MTTKDLELDRSAVATMVARFAFSLSARGLTGRIARLETRLSWPSSPDAPFALEAAMTAAWPHDCATPPRARTHLGHQYDGVGRLGEDSARSISGGGCCWTADTRLPN